MSVRILSTKKLQPNQKQFLLNAGFAVVDADFIAVTVLEYDFVDIQDNLIFTSQNAVVAVASHENVQEIRRNPVFCVGNKTADLLDEVGFTVVETADSAAELGKIIVQSYASESFTFFSGSIRRNELPEILQSADVELNEIEVYKTTLTPVSVQGDFDAVLFFSPSGVQSFLRANSIGNVVSFCIGETTAHELSGKTDKIVVANKPSVENVIIQTLKYFGQPSNDERPTENNESITN